MIPIVISYSILIATIIMRYNLVRSHIHNDMGILSLRVEVSFVEQMIDDDEIPDDITDALVDLIQKNEKFEADISELDVTVRDRIQTILVAHDLSHCFEEALKRPLWKVLLGIGGL